MKTILYGSLCDCTRGLFDLIDWDGAFPNVDFAAVVDEDAPSANAARKTAEGWFGIKDFGKKFDADTFSLMFAHYGGGGVESMELMPPEDSERDAFETEFMEHIGASTSAVGYGALGPDDMTVFEVKFAPKKS